VASRPVLEVQHDDLEFQLDYPNNQKAMTNTAKQP
jgi:hypothetical protein